QLGQFAIQQFVVGGIKGIELFDRQFRQNRVRFALAAKAQFDHAELGQFLRERQRVERELVQSQEQIVLSVFGAATGQGQQGGESLPGNGDGKVPIECRGRR